MTTETLKNILLRINAIETAIGEIKSALNEDLYERSGEQEKTPKEVRYVRDDPFDCSNESDEVTPEDKSDNDNPSPAAIAHNKYMELCANYPLFKFMIQPNIHMVNTLYDFFKLYRVKTCPSNCCGNERSACNFILNGVSPEGVNVCMCVDFLRDITDNVYINVTVTGSNSIVKNVDNISSIAKASQRIAIDRVFKSVSNPDALQFSITSCDNDRMWKIDQNNNGMSMTYAIGMGTDGFTSKELMHYKCAFIIEFFRIFMLAVITRNTTTYPSAQKEENASTGTKCPVRKYKRKDF